MPWETAFRCALLAIGLGIICRPLSAQLPRPLDQLAAELEPTRCVVYKTINGRPLRLHIFEPPQHQATDRRSAFLTVHGGGWTGGEARRSYPLAKHFARLGMVGVSLEYRLMDRTAGTTVFDCVKDGRSAVRYLRRHAEELGIDPRRIVVSGNSAGGHVAAGTALFDGVDEADEDTSISCRPDALVLYYPVIDTSQGGYGREKIGQRWRELSPVEHVRARLPPTIVFHGTADSVTPYAGAVAFRERMELAGNICELVSHEAGRHGYFIFDLKLYEQAMDSTHRFLRKQRLIDGP